MHNQRSHRRRRPELLVGVVCLALLGVSVKGLWRTVDRLFHTHSLFLIPSVSIQGADSRLTERLQPMIAPWEGLNYWEVRHQRAALREVALELPAVEDVVVHTYLPHHVRLRIVPRTPLGQLRAEGRFFLFDRDGMLFNVSEQSWPEVPVVYGPAPHPLALNSHLDMAAIWAVRACLQAVEQLRQQGKAVALQAISVSPEGILQMRWRNGLMVRLGAPFELPEKLEAVLRIQQRLTQDREVEYVDVSALEVPVWKPKPASG